MGTDLMGMVLYDQSEITFVEWAEKAGWRVGRSGWPDFLLEKCGEIKCVEVKLHRHTPLRPGQRRVLSALASYGVPCFVWTPDDGFVRFPTPIAPRETAPVAVFDVLLARLEEMATARAAEQRRLQDLGDEVRALRARWAATEVASA
jgi:hypothetical protein